MALRDVVERLCSNCLDMAYGHLHLMTLLYGNHGLELRRTPFIAQPPAPPWAVAAAVDQTQHETREKHFI
eukprot:scaffold2750_cov380-Prasinococcus_capsulatus_cf.AAC.5